ncbi:MAG: DUF5686 family protein [Owenweeksia sp.]|nr:DUF5686 family protein [Owenweeksia sp.]
MKGKRGFSEEDKEVSRKQFRKLMEQYEKEEREASGEEDVISDYSYEIDSTAAQKDSAYWAQIRTVPLTEKEAEGYRKDDSTYAATGGDSARANWEAKFQASHILFGVF